MTCVIATSSTEIQFFLKVSSKPIQRQTTCHKRNRSIIGLIFCFAQLVDCLEQGRVVGTADDFVKRTGQPGRILQEILELKILTPVEERRMIRRFPGSDDALS